MPRIQKVCKRSWNEGHGHKYMGRNRHAKQKRIRAVGDQALESEIRRNEQKIPDVLPNSALFEEKGEKKKKILLHPRPPVEPVPGIADVEYTDLWGAAPTKQPTKRKAPRTIQLPTSEDSYRSVKHLKKVEPVEETNEVADPTAIVIHAEPNQGMGDTLAGDVLDWEQPDVKAPAPKLRERCDIQFTAKIPRWLPDEQKKERRRILREAHREIRARKERALLPEFENVPEIAEEVRNKIKEEMEKPKKEKDGLERYIAADPGFDNETVPSTLGDVAGDSRPFTRLQNYMERNRKMALHE